ncbi:TOBE domain-containing protein [Amycolatopsis sp. NPDC004368]
MPQYRISEAVKLLGVSDDTMRRHIDVGTLTAAKDKAKRAVIAGEELGEFARRQGEAAPDPISVGRSARNRMVVLVTSVVADKVMAQVEIQRGRDRVVSLMSTEAVRELGIEPGSLAVAT